MTLATLHFRKFFSGVTLGLFLGARAPNLNFVTLAILERLGN